jgi:hypothetical protein
MLPKIVNKLHNNEVARVRFPKPDECLRLAELVNNREPLVHDVIGFVDGVKIPVECNSSEEEQAIDYNGYGQDTYCNNVFLFGSDGKIKWGAINCPGSWHDSLTSLPLRALCLQRIAGTFKVCVDQGFQRGGDMWGIFVGPMSRRQWRKVSDILKPYLRRDIETYISLRQSSEWGMRALQATFSRLKSRLTSDRIVRRRLITAIVLLHNFRTELVGLNQIATVFNPHYEASINIDGYDRLHRYFRHLDE